MIKGGTRTDATEAGGERHRRPDRGQSVVIGSILMFAIGIALLSSIQAFVVPQQVEKTELGHQNIVDDDFTRLHGGLMNAASQSSEYTATFKLGADYDDGLLTIKPPSASGSLRSEDLGQYDASFEDANGVTRNLKDVCGLNGETTQALQYTPNYNQLRGVGTHGYENTVTFQSVNNSLAEYNSNLVNNNVIRLRPLVGSSVSTSSSGSTSVDFYAGEKGRIAIKPDQELKFPTSLNGSEWQTILKGSDFLVADFDKTDNEVTIGYDDGGTGSDYVLQCRPLGVNQPPDNVVAPPFTPGDSDTQNDLINPITEQVLVFTGSSSGGSQSILADFENRNGSSSREVVGVRVASAQGTGNSQNKDIKLTPEVPGSSTTVEIGAGFDDSVSWTWSQNSGNRYIKISSPPGGVNLNNIGQVTLQLRFDNGETATYQVSTDA